MTTLLTPTSSESRGATLRSTPKWLFALGGIAIALTAGAAGAGLTQLAFTPEAGSVGPAGPTGLAGSIGPVGAPGNNAASQRLDTNKVGYCFDYSYQYNSDINWIDSVSLFAPTSNNGTLSCPSGSFISLTPTGPNGLPVKNYSATRPE